MKYVLWYVYKDYRFKYKSFVSMKGANLFKKILINKLKNKYPMTCHQIEFYILKDNDPVYEIWWVYPDGTEDLSDCDEFYTEEDLYFAMEKEQLFWQKWDPNIEVVARELYYIGEYSQYSLEDEFTFLSNPKFLDSD